MASWSCHQLVSHRVRITGYQAGLSHRSIDSTVGLPIPILRLIGQNSASDRPSDPAELNARQTTDLSKLLLSAHSPLLHGVPFTSPKL
eukprot:scaffold18800_cov92-Skeletonema_marinoi.AAC.1